MKFVLIHTNMRLVWAAIPLIVMVFTIGIVGVQDVDGLWIARSTEELVKQSHTIVIGNVTSIDVIHTTQTSEIVGEFDSADDLPVGGFHSSKILWEKDGSKAYELTYVSNIEEITIDVEEYLKNLPMSENTIVKARAPLFAVGVPTLHTEISSKFELGDRVLLYFTGSLINQTYTRESFVTEDNFIATAKDGLIKVNGISQHLSPKKQFESGINLENIICKEGLELIFKQNNSPACVKPSTAEKLIERGWILFHDTKQILAQQLTPKQACEEIADLGVYEVKMSCYGDSELAQKMCDEREWMFGMCEVSEETCSEIDGMYLRTSGCLPPRVWLEQRDTDTFLAKTDYGMCEQYLEICVVENSVRDFRIENQP